MAMRLDVKIFFAAFLWNKERDKDDMIHLLFIFFKYKKTNQILHKLLLSRIILVIKVNTILLLNTCGTEFLSWRANTRIGNCPWTRQDYFLRGEGKRWKMEMGWWKWEEMRRFRRDSMCVYVCVRQNAEWAWREGRSWFKLKAVALSHHITTSSHRSIRNSYSFRRSRSRVPFSLSFY